MFKKTLADQLKRIFDFDKVSFDRPGESQEQEGLFVEIKNARTRIVDGRQIGKIDGTLHVFANSDKLPYGYFSKCLDAARSEDTRGLFFHNFEENVGTFRNIVERSLDFLYLFDSQYDPALGTLNQIDLSVAEN